MTATPIPRTVAMTVFGDLETSTLTELPAGRAPIQTNVVPLAEQPTGSTGSGSGCARRSTRATRSTSCARGSPATSSSRASATSVDVDEDGQRPPTPRSRAGRRRGARRRAGRRAAGRAAARASCTAGCRPTRRTGRCAPSPPARSTCCVATTVIEVGVDVANATAMVLLDADRFGVSQLHQLRGRVGRGGLPGSACWSPTPRPARPARERLDAVAATTDGFELSRVDLEQRREGDVLGALAVRASAPACRTCGCSATRRRSCRARARRRRCSTTIRTSRAPRCSPQRWQTWSNHGSLTSWRSHDVSGHVS